MLLLKRSDLLEIETLANKIYYDWATFDVPISAILRNDSTARHLRLLREKLTTLEFSASVAYISRIITSMNRPNAFFDEGGKKQILRMLEELKTWIESENDQVFLYVTKNSRQFLTAEGVCLFGDKVAQSFASTIVEIHQAGRCMAFELYTACVFHLMRVLEKGLLALAYELSVESSRSIEFENWKNIIDMIEKAIRKFEQTEPRGEDKARRAAFYSQSAVQFFHFKEAWRNHTMHGRAAYDEPAARIIWEHSKEFMIHLANNGMNEVS